MRAPAVALRYDHAPGSAQRNKGSAPSGGLHFSREQDCVVTGTGLLPTRKPLEVRIVSRLKLLPTPAASARADGNLRRGPRGEHRRRPIRFGTGTRPALRWQHGRVISGSAAHGKRGEEVEESPEGDHADATADQTAATRCPQWRP